MRMAVGVCLQLYHKAVEWPRVVVQGTQRFEPQSFESQVVEIVHVEEMVDYFLVEERKVVGFMFLVWERVEFLVLVKVECQVVEKWEFLVVYLDCLFQERKYVGLCQTELVQVLVLVWLQYLDFVVWSGIF